MAGKLLVILLLGTLFLPFRGHAEEPVDVTAGDVLDMLGFDYSKRVFTGEPHRHLALVFPYDMQATQDPVVLPFSDGDKVELLVWINPKEDKDAVRTVHYRLWNSDRQLRGEVNIRKAVTVHGKVIQLNNKRDFLSQTIGRTDLRGGAVGLGEVYGENGEVLGSIEVVLK
jgi:hypothetical protein